MTEPAAPHPSDSERTGYADRAAQYCGGCPHQAIAHGYRERPKPIPAGRCHSGSCPCDQFTPRPSVPEFLRGLANERGYIKTSLDHALDEYARLSPSTGTPEEPTDVR